MMREFLTFITNLLVLFGAFVCAILIVAALCAVGVWLLSQTIGVVMLVAFIILMITCAIVAVRA